jgi:hypothetical protein
MTGEMSNPERCFTSDYEILEQEGPLHVFRQPSPWSLQASWAERILDLLTSFLPRK